MLFNSFDFVAAFLPIVFLVYLALLSTRKYRLISLWLIVVSLYFYAYHTPKNLLLLITGIVFNYFMAERVKSTRSRLVLAFGIAINLCVLAYFKFANFVSENILNVFGTRVFEIQNIVLPLAISFFTFQQIAYLVDSIKRTEQISFSDYLLTIVYFPHLIAGPIVLYRDLVPQLRQMLQTSNELQRNISIGMTIFCCGLIKKLAIADPLALIADRGFSTDSLTSTYFAWIGVLAYTMQIYFDFSAYSDMALGLSRMFGLNLPINFFSPYKSTSIIEFWRRWHISLSNFLRDYLYIPLGGSRCSKPRRYMNLMLTMLLGGLWHGAAWTFVIWGALHGTYLIINHIYRSVQFLPRIPTVLSWCLTFLAVLVAWVFFRAPDVNFSFNLLNVMFLDTKLLLPLEFRSTLSSIFPDSSFKYTATVFIFRPGEELSWFAFCVAPFIACFSPNVYELLKREAPALNLEKFVVTSERSVPIRFNPATGLLLALVCLWLVLSQSVSLNFLYFQF